LALELGDISLIIQVVIFFLLILGLPFAKGLKSKKNFAVHGYLTTLAIALHTVLISAFMVTNFVGELSKIGELSVLDALNVWLHVVFGMVAEVLGVLLVVSWLRNRRSLTGCARWKRWMMPTFVIWAVALVGGAVVHLLEIV